MVENGIVLRDDCVVPPQAEVDETGRLTGNILYVETADISADAIRIVESAQSAAYRAVNVAMVWRNWLLGRRIAVEEFKGEDRAEYGKEVIKTLARTIADAGYKGLNRINLYYCVRFYRAFPQIVYALREQSGTVLPWTHYRSLLRVTSPDARDWYEHEAQVQSWSSRTLDRNIQSQYYERMLLSQHPDKAQREMERITEPYQHDKLEFVKNPVVAEFLNLDPKGDFTETELEASIISNLQKFLLELGKGYAFMARQKHIRTEKQDYFIDLVFYNVILKCYMLIDLKTSKVTHQDVGQMDMYVRMYDELVKGADDNPTLGIVLCADTDEDIARYSVLHDSDQLFAAKYETYLPTQEELRAEIETQKHIFELQQAERADGVLGASENDCI